MKRIILLGLILAAAGSLAAAQLYRWVDDKGNVEYRDTPPPQSAKKVEERRLGATAAPAPPSPYAVQVAVKNFPVTLWAYDCGEPCTNARALLAKRGVPYTEKDPKADLKAFEKLTGSTGVPVLFVGPTRLQGYLQADWDNTLDAAGYPRTAPPGTVPAPKPAAAPTAKPGVDPKPAPSDQPVVAAPEGTAPAPKPGGPPGRPGK